MISVAATPPTPSRRVSASSATVPLVFAALGRFDYRFRRWIPPIGLAIVIGLTIWSNQAGGELSQGGWQIAGSESKATEELLADRFGEQATAIFVILRDPAGDAASDEFAQVVDDAVAPLADDPAVDGITTYADTGDPRFLSTDGTTTFALVRLNSPDEEAVADSQRLVALVAAARRGRDLGHRRSGRVRRVQRRDRGGPAPGRDHQPAHRRDHPAGRVRDGGRRRAATPDRRHVAARHLRRHQPAGQPARHVDLRHQPGHHDRPGPGHRLLAVPREPLPRGAAPPPGRRGGGADHGDASARRWRCPAWRWPSAWAR